MGLDMKRLHTTSSRGTFKILCSYRKGTEVKIGGKKNRGQSIYLMK